MKHQMTGEQIKEYFDKVDKNIKTSGYHLTNVFASKDRPSFFYSTGIYKTFGIPEIFISSLLPGLCSELVEKYVKVLPLEMISTTDVIQLVSLPHEIFGLTLTIVETFLKKGMNCLREGLLPC